MHTSALDDTSEAGTLLPLRQRSSRDMSCHALETEEPKQQEQVISGCLRPSTHML